MTGKASELDLPQMASLLKVRQDAGTHTALFLGAKTGKLFQNRQLYSTLKQFGPGSFDSLPPQEQFQECYRILGRQVFNAHDLYLILLRALENIRIEASDLMLAELARQGIFNPLITTNIDTGLEQALGRAGIKRLTEFEVFIPNKQRLHFDVKVQVIKAFGDLESQEYAVNQRLQYLENHKDLQEIIENARKRNVLMIGVDPIWDEALIPQFFHQDGAALWYVNDEHPPPNSLLSRFLEQHQASLFIRNDGNYESFFKILHWHITREVPKVYEMLFVTEVHMNELTHFQEAFDALVDPQALSRTSLINFFGVDGMGKTSLLQEVRQRCHGKGVPCLMVDASQKAEDFLHDIITQVQIHHSVQLTYQLIKQELYGQSLHAIKAMLETQPLVILLDSVNMQDEQQFSQLESMLGELIDNLNLLVIMASKQKISFNRNRSLGRMINPIPLKSFDRVSSGVYLSRIGHDLNQELREHIFAWTRGYPLAMTAMTQAILGDKLDPRIPGHQTQLFATIMSLVIDNKAFATIERNQLPWYKKVVSLLSQPRRFNLTLIQELVETFEPESAPQSTLEYLGLPKQIQQKTNVLSWDLQRVGFTIAEPIRNLFFQFWRLEQPERFYQIHRFLADYNLQNVQRTLGSDSAHAWHEYLYHSAFSADQQFLSEIIQQTVQHIIDHDSPDALVQFSEEITQDEELQEALGEQMKLLSTLINESLGSGA